MRRRLGELRISVNGGAPYDQLRNDYLEACFRQVDYTSYNGRFRHKITPSVVGDAVELTIRPMYIHTCV